MEDHFLEGVITAILLFTKTGRGGTDQVWFYDMTADGWSLDDKRNLLLPLQKLGEVEHRPPLEILAELRVIEQEILQGMLR